MEQLRRIIASNIAALRQKAGMTQQDLAEKLNYTDKAVSKWERGESVPDISVLKRLADIFGVTVDRLISDPGAEQTPTEQADDGVRAAAHEQQTNMAKLASIFGFRSERKFTVTLMAAAAVWFAAVTAFALLTVFAPQYPRPWICFLIAVPATAIVLLIFNILWGRMQNSFALMAACVWTILGALFIFFIKHQPWTIFLIGIPAQAILLLWQILYNRRSGK
ncbi:MAG: helix-turn-helix transcriptional regulator [Clostridia bacterium]|nr:helix-turn-helix transcriptional regulator [Clostridia bacterium]